MDEAHKEEVRRKVQNAMAWSMEGYNFGNIISDAELTAEDEEWALDNLDWQVVILEDTNG